MSCCVCVCVCVHSLFLCRAQSDSSFVVSTTSSVPSLDVCVDSDVLLPSSGSPLLPSLPLLPVPEPWCSPPHSALLLEVSSLQLSPSASPLAVLDAVSLVAKEETGMVSCCSLPLTALLHAATLSRLQQERDELKGEVERVSALLQRESEELGRAQHSALLTHTKLTHRESQWEKERQAQEEKRHEETQQLMHQLELVQQEVNTVSHSAHHAASVYHTHMCVKDQHLDLLTSQLNEARTLVSSLQHQMEDRQKQQEAREEEQQQQLNQLMQLVDNKEKQRERELQEQARLLQDVVGKHKREQRECRKLRSLLQEYRGNIRVFARVRPLSSSELSLPAVTSCVCVVPSDDVECPPRRVLVQSVSGVSHSFTFDHALSPSSTQSDVFSGVCELMTSVMDGYFVSIFAYGQTGAGHI